jgi:lipopolysaccharide/colanic/teichoic acid biosynthesis glycosyltransferase
MTNALREKADSSRLPRFPVRLRISLKRPHPEVLGEDVFRRILCWERKRAERSSRSFVLMLVNIGRIVGAHQTGRVLTEIVSAVSQCARETDVAGWYLEGTVLGVIFTELGEGSGEVFSRLTRARVIGALETKLAPEALGQIHISFHFFPNQWDKSILDRLANAKLYPDLFEEDKETKFFRFVKRVMDIAGSTLALILCSPVLAAISLAIKLTSKGPILFKQERIGQYGLRFKFLKFRSMKCGNDPSIHREYVKRFIAGEVDPDRVGDKQNAVYKIQDDPRVTRVGKFLRRTSLDELPQFINVLKGDMSLVGPRPPIPYELETYQTWHRRRVLEVKPGITGLWQVNGRSKTTFNEMVRLDLRYARTWSPWLDIKILLQTPGAVFSGEGAY